MGSGLNNAVYLGILVIFIAGTAAFAYAGSDRRTVVVEGKYVKTLSGRLGRISERLVLRTSAGELPILQFPLIGYLSGAEDLYASISSGDEIDVRVGPWPPRMITGDAGPLNIMEVY